MAGRSSKATILEMGDGAGIEVFTAIANLTKIKAPKFGTGHVDVTSFDDAANVFVADGIQDHGDISIEGNWLAEVATQNETAGLLAKAKAGTLTNFKVKVPLAAGVKTFAFGAFVMMDPDVGGPKDALKFSATLKISGAITIS